MNSPSVTRIPQQDRARVTREAILSAATQLLGAEGAKSVTHRRVADMAGVSLASTTYHFKNKAELLSAAFDWLIEIYISNVRARLRASMGDDYTKKGLADLLVGISRHTFRRKDERDQICAWYEFMLEAARNPALQDTANRWYSETCDYYEEVLEKCKSRHPREDARRLVDCMIGYEMSALAAGRENYGAKSLRQTYTRLVESMFDDEA